MTGPGGQVWEVVGGGDKGGIVVREGKDVTSSLQAERLSTGALIKEVKLEDGRLQYQRLSGTGPGEGWVSLKLQDGRELVQRSSKPAPNGKPAPGGQRGPGQTWQVVGGEGKGGILVRTGKDTASPAEAERLSTGALVRELELDGVRLHFERQTGTGPRSGWVSINLDDGKVLLTKQAGKAAAAPGAPGRPVLVGEAPLPEALEGAAKAILRERPAAAIPKELARTLRSYAAEELQDFSSNQPGAHFGEQFPHSPEQLQMLGPEWYTASFHRAGTLPLDNKVARVVSQRDFIGGGAALKAIVTLEYEQPSEDLHTELFVKMPLPLGHKNRDLNIRLAQEGKEVFFLRFFSACMPFRSPKYYFGEISMATTNWLIITEKVDFADNSRRGETFGPGQVEPIVRKGLDFCLPNPLEKYVAMYRRAAMLTAWFHNGKLGVQLPDYYDPPSKYGFMIGFPVPAKAFDDFWPKIEEFVLERAPQLFPSDVANPAYLAQLRGECMEVGPGLGKVNKYVTTGDDLWGFMHQNLHIDNAFFFRDAEGRQDCGLFDWGGLGPGFLLNQFVSGGGALSLAGADMRVPYSDALVRCYFDTLTEFGGPQLDPTDMSVRVALMDMAYVVGTMRLIETGRPGDVYEYLPKEGYANVSGPEDTVFTADTIEALMLRSTVNMLVEGIKTWKGRDYAGIFSRWRG